MLLAFLAFYMLVRINFLFWSLTDQSKKLKKTKRNIKQTISWDMQVTQNVLFTET